MRNIAPILVRRSALGAALAAAWILSAFHPAAAALRARIDLDVADLRIQDTASGTRVLLGGETPDGAGAELPSVERMFYVPAGLEVRDVRVIGRDEMVAAEGVRLDVPGVVPESGVRSLGGGNLGGFRLHSVALYPVRWEEASGRLTFTRSFDVELELAPRSGVEELVRLRPSPAADEMLLQALASLVVNPADLPSPATLRAVASGPATFAPEELPSVEGSAVDMVIVTNDALAAAFQPLADWKTRKGVPALVRTVEWIDANYPAGHDRPERVRAFLRDAYVKWGTYLVLVGGDHDVVPPRYAWNTFYLGGAEIPTDQYFACLDGTWNADGDDRFGEGQFISAPGDSIDMYPDVLVGRAPVESAEEVATFIAKSLTYDKNPPVGYVSSHGGLAEVLFPPDWEYGDPPGAISTDGKVLLQDSLDVHLPVGWTRSLRYQSDNDENRQIALAELSAGHHVFTVVGHGDAFKFSAGNGVNPFVQTSDTDTLTNGDRLMVFLGVACNPNEINLESQGESLMNNPNGGAVVVFGSTRVDFPIASTTHQAQMLHAAFQGGATRFGAMSQLGRVARVASSVSDATAERWTWLSKLLLGDPELSIWTSEPGTLVVAHPSSVTLAATSVTVTVLDGGATPVAGALVCVSDGDGTYSRVVTDASGQAIVPLASAQAGVADIVVTKGGFRPHESTLTVDAGAGAHLASTSVVIDDDTVGSSNGNGDGVLDAGETFELAVTVHNGGGAATSSSFLIGAIEFGTSATFDLAWNGVPDPSKVFVGPDRVHPAAVPFTLDFANPVLDYIGKPTFTLVSDSLPAGGAAADVGIFLWQDREGWHLQWGGEPDSVTVTGTVSTDGRVRRVSSMDLELPDSYALIAGGDSLTFSGTTHGADAADGLDFHLADNTMVAMVGSAAALGNIAPSASVLGTLVAQVSPSARDGQVAYVDLTMTSSSGGPWPGEYPLVFAGPELEAYVVAVDDSSGAPVSGNGNGVVEVGETVRLTPTVINRGTGEAPSVNGTATAASGITFVDASDAYGAIASLAEAAGTDGYVFTVNDPTGTTIDLTLTDGLGRSWAKTIDFVAPGAPDSIWFESTPSAITVSWTPSDSAASADLAGYRVYRSATPVGGHQLVGFELVRAGSRYVDEELALGSQFYYRVSAVDSSGNESTPSPQILAWTTQAQVPGWPRRTGGFIYPGLAMADADRAQADEIYIGSHDFDFYGWNDKGALRSGFPISTAFEIWSTAAVVDLDEDGDDEILFGGRDSRMYAVHHDGMPVFGSQPWLVDLPGTGEGIRSAITVADLDGDDHLEFVFGTDLGTVYAFNHDGTGVVDSTGLLFTAPPGNVNARIWGTIAVADLDLNGTMEIVFGSFNDSLYVVDATGARAPGFPKGSGDDFRGGPVVGDLDDDGTLEIVAGSFDGNLYVYNHDGSPYISGGILATLPEKIGAGAALANVDGDPELEVFIGCLDANLYAYNHDGSSFLPGQGGLFADLPLGPGATEGISASPIVVDVDGDADFEILVGHRNSNFYGFHHDGSPVVGMPIPTGDYIFSTAAAGDIDHDGDVDVAFASYDGSVNVLDFPGASVPTAYEWGTYGANNRRTSAYGDRDGATDAPDLGGAARPVFSLDQNAPNPFHRRTTIRYAVPAGQRISLRVFDVSGRLVRSLVEGVVPAGRGAVQWDGRDGRGRVVSSGIYFYRLDNGEESVTRKGLLLR